MGYDRLIHHLAAERLPGTPNDRRRTRAGWAAALAILLIVGPAWGQDSAYMVEVPAGEFQMGDPWNEGNTDERPVHTVYLNPFSIDTYEVTNQQYVTALNWASAQGGLVTVTDGVVYKYGSGTSYPYCSTTSAPPGSPYLGNYTRITWNGSTFGVVSGKESHPMVVVSWYGAAAYCNWRSAMEGKPPCYNLSTWACSFAVSGYRLPTEAEWEKAGAWDPVQQRHYRFAQQSDGCGYDCLDAQRANYLWSGHPYEPGAPPETTPIGFYDGELHYKVDFGWPGSQTSYQTQNARTYYGGYDMCGNVWEWCYDWYSSTYYASSPPSNPAGPTSGTHHVVRGGSWNYNVGYCRSAIRGIILPDSWRSSAGFRCVVGRCPGDLNGDGFRNVTDFTMFAAAYGSQIGEPNYNADADLNGDGFVNVTDFTQFASVFGVLCP